MNDKRTYGVEIEMVSTISKEEMAERVNRAVARFGHTCEVHGCYRQSPAHQTVWELKHDGSIASTEEYRYTMELVSPVLKGETGLEILKAVCEALNGFATVNRSCGLHVHHGINDGDNISNIILGWLRAEDTIYKCLPPSRRMGRYALPLKAVLRHNGRQVPTNPPERTWWRRNINTRFVGLNLESYWLRGTIEVRAAAGTVEYEKIKNWVIVTQRLIDLASKNPEELPDDSHDIKALTKALFGGGQGIEWRLDGAPQAVKIYAVWKALGGETARVTDVVRVVRALPNPPGPWYTKTWITRLNNGERPRGYNKREYYKVNTTQQHGQQHEAAEWLEKRYEKFSTL